MGVMVDQAGNPLSGANASYNSGFIGSYGEGGGLTTGYSWPLEKYYDKYAYGTSYTDYTKRILGDATGEMGPFQSVVYGSLTRLINSWYTNHADFVYSSGPWFIRGGSHNDGSESGLVSFSSVGDGSIHFNIGFRVVLTP